MGKPIEARVERRWYFSVRVNLERGVGAMGIEKFVRSLSGDPRLDDVMRAEEKAADSFTERGERVLGAVCTGWYPLDDDES